MSDRATLQQQMAKVVNTVPREFRLERANNKTTIKIASKEKIWIGDDEIIHVIEFEAYQKIKEQNAKLAHALGWAREVLLGFAIYPKDSAVALVAQNGLTKIDNILTAHEETK